MFYFNRRRSREATPSASKTHRPLSCFFFAAALTGSIGTAHAIECRSEKGSGYPWAWRLIDGKRCWYKGKPGMDKKLLRWAENPSVPAASRSAAKSVSKSVSKNASKRASKRSPSIITDYAERESLLQSYWPPLPPANTFDDRFGAPRAKRL